MNIRLKEDIKSVSLFRTNPSTIFRQVRTNQRPVVVTERGKPSVVIVDVEDYERQKEKMELMEAILEGEKDFREGHPKTLKQIHAETRRWLTKE